MGIDVTVDIEISSDPQAVFVFLADPVNDPEWIGGVQKSELLSAGPVSLGTRSGAQPVSWVGLWNT